MPAISIFRYRAAAIGSCVSCGGRTRLPDFANCLQYIQAKLPDAGIGTDVLVGFPGETEEDFAETCELIRESPLTYLHVFPFSPREGTVAFSMPDRIPSQVMKRRLTQSLKYPAKKPLIPAPVHRPAITLSREENLGTSLVLTGNYIHARVSGLSVPPNRLVIFGSKKSVRKQPTQRYSIPGFEIGNSLPREPEIYVAGLTNPAPAYADQTCGSVWKLC